MIKLGLAGKPVLHSLSPKIFKTFFEQFNLKGTYFLFEAPTERAFANLINDFLRPGLTALNVTVPYKEIAYIMAERRMRNAALLGSSNLLWHEKRKLICENTDLPAMKETIKNTGVEITNRTAAIIGAGGAARAAILTLKDLGMENIYITSRTHERVISLCKEFSEKHKINCIPTKSDKVKDIDTDLDILINASPAGMHPKTDQLPLGNELLGIVRSRGLAFDLIYNPLKTKFLRKAESLSIKTLNGLEMLVLQAAIGFEMLTGKKPDISLTTKNIEKEFK